MSHVDRTDWMDLLGLSDGEVPRLLVLEPTWWRRSTAESRLRRFEHVRALGMPDLWLGWSGGVPIGFSTAYGATGVVEPLHALGACGTPVVVQIGPCSALQPTVRRGDVVLPERALVGEGVSQYYGGQDVASANLGRLTRAASMLAGRGLHVHRGSVVTAGARLRQPPELLEHWADAGHLAVDLTTSAVYTAASAFSMRATSVLWCREERTERPWSTSLREDPAPAQEDVSELVYEVALSLA
jgi:uridine phosphorylase